jgi:predicted ABC-type ATPase
MGHKINDGIPRMRMFAGPNGSGKSTIKSMIDRELIGIYINPDEMEQEMRDRGFLDLAYYQVQTSREEVLEFFKKSDLLKHEDLLDETECLRFNDEKLIFHDIGVNSYFASVAADFIRQKLLAAKKSFSFETVMSHPGKIDVMHRARQLGYRNYLYFIATEDPMINMTRIEYRVEHGGHFVPEDKMTARYERSLELLLSALETSNRAYIFDNSREQPVWIAEITEGKTLETKTDELPAWFTRVIGNRLK